MQWENWEIVAAPANAPDRLSSDVVGRHPQLIRYLEEGWEPFSVIPTASSPTVWLRRQKKMPAEVGTAAPRT